MPKYIKIIFTIFTLLSLSACSMQKYQEMSREYSMYGAPPPIFRPMKIPDNVLRHCNDYAKQVLRVDLGYITDETRGQIEDITIACLTRLNWFSY
jgi:hypothetical protein